MDKIQDRFSPIFDKLSLTQWLQFWTLNQAETIITVVIAEICIYFHRMKSLGTQNDNFGHSKWQLRVSKSLNFIERFHRCPILFSLALVTLKSFPSSSLAVLNWVKWFWHLACHSKGAICVLLPGFFMIFQFLRAFHSSNQERKLRDIHKLRGTHNQFHLFVWSRVQEQTWLSSMPI